MHKEPIIMAERQAALAKIYNSNPIKAWITDSASVKSTPAKVQDPLHGEVNAAGLVIPIAVHSAVGGESDGAVPGDILCASLASCMDSTIRLIANRLRIEIFSIEIKVTADVDVRGTLCLDPKVPVAFQKMHLSTHIDLPLATNAKLINALFQSAESCCVVFQTLRSALTMTTQFHANNDPYFTNL